jgi:hypothetical protein
MGRKITIAEDGKTRRVPALAAMLHRMSSEALRGDKAALKLLLPLYERYADSTDGARQTEELLREDMEILAKYGMLDLAKAEDAPPNGDLEPHAPAGAEVEP